MSQNFLKRILEQKEKEIAARRQQIPEAELRRQIKTPVHRRSFRKALMGAGPGDVRVIAEIKRASPSKGVFRKDLNAPEMARHYESGGAAAISVLTDPVFFHGSGRDLIAVRARTSLPVLRKDFIISPYQVYEAAAWGADAVLLIVRILTEKRLAALLQICRRLDLDALVEVYAPAEIQTATAAGAAIIGINNRNLETFRTDIRRAIQMAPLLGSHQIAVVASGITSRADVRQNVQAGLHHFLIGEHLVRARDPRKRLQTLRGVRP